MTGDDLFLIAQDFMKWLEDMAEKYGAEESDIQELIKSLLK